MTPTDHAVAAMLDTFRRAPIERDYSDKDLRAALGSSPPLEKMKMGQASDQFNALPFEERQRLAPLLTETRIETLKVVRSILEKHHHKAVGEINVWIKNNEQSLIDGAKP